ncbi:MAG: DUF2232 domain-containing protein, partial [Treponema sp.]|nr:DUF2232 domain-containing protein [Treponema sp.]
MRQANSQAPEQIRILVPALICGLLSAIATRAGFLSLFFLVPLGIIAALYDSKSAWYSWASAAIANVLITVIIYFQTGFQVWIINIAYFSLISMGFVWIMAGGKKARIRTVYRFIIASGAGALVLLLLLLDTGSGFGFRDIIKKQAELLSSLYISAAGADAAKQSLLEQALTPDNLLNLVTQVMLRGGALVSCFFIFYFSRQIAVFLAQLFFRRRGAASLRVFHAPGRTIWVLSACLGMALIFHRLQLKIPEIITWNLLVICGVVFLAQGAGIVLHLLQFRSQL